MVRIFWNISAQLLEAHLLYRATLRGVAKIWQEEAQIAQQSIPDWDEVNRIKRFQSQFSTIHSVVYP